MKRYTMLAGLLLSATGYAAEHKKNISAEEWKQEMQRWMDEQSAEEPVAQQSPRRLKVPMGFISAKQKELSEIEQKAAGGYSFFGVEDAQKEQD